jgi:hypothetical protein
MTLRRADFRTETWDRLAEHLQVRLQDLRTQLETDSPPEVTAKLRGRIREIKDLLALPQAAPARRTGPSEPSQRAGDDGPDD